MIYDYDNNYNPPFPAVTIILHNHEEERSTNQLQALLDTGADGSIVPLDLLKQILAPALVDTNIRSHWGEWRSVQLFAVEIEVAQMNLKFTNLFVVGDDSGDEIILGRDFINKLKLHLDGPTSIVTIPNQ